VAYATEDNGSLAKIGNASRLGNNSWASRSLRNGRPNISRFTTEVIGAGTPAA
jgi:hypothetical protein